MQACLQTAGVGLLLWRKATLCWVFFTANREFYCFVNKAPLLLPSLQELGEKNTCEKIEL